MKLDHVLALLLVSSILSKAHSCSCVDSSFRRPRGQVIEDSFCSTYSPEIYIARVVGATCNCLPDETDRTRLNCLDYQIEGATTTVNAEVVQRGLCDEQYNIYNQIGSCTDLPTNLSTTGLTVQGPSDTSLPEITNFSSSDSCRFTCYFNLNTNALGTDFGPFEIQPCVYNVSIEEVFKGNNSTTTTITPGPDVLTSCGAEGLFLRLNQRYIVGIGGACEPIPEWSTVGSYSSSEISFMRELRQAYEDGSLECGDIATLPSLALTALTLLVTLCKIV